MGTLGIAGGNVATSAITGLVGGAIQQHFDIEAENRAWEKQMALYERQYRDNSPANRLKQYQEAGLSPGLMYGGSSAGGGASQGFGAPMAKSNIGMNYIDLMAIESQKANINLANANAEKARAEANKIGGVDTQLATQTIENLKSQQELIKYQSDLNKWEAENEKIVNYIKSVTKDFNIEIVKQGVEQSKAITEKNKWEAENEKIDNYIKSSTKDFNIEIVKQGVEQSKAITEKLLNEADISTKTKEEIIKTYSATLGNIYMQTALMGSEKAVNWESLDLIKTNVEKLINDMMIDNKKIEQGYYQLETQMLIARLNSDTNMSIAELNNKTDLEIRKLANENNIKITNIQGAWSIANVGMFNGGRWIDSMIPGIGKGKPNKIGF